MKNFWQPKYKYQFIEWIYTFYKGKYSKYEIGKKNVKGWYYNIRFNLNEGR